MRNWFLLCWFQLYSVSVAKNNLLSQVLDLVQVNIDALSGKCTCVRMNYLDQDLNHDDHRAVFLFVILMANFEVTFYYTGFTSWASH